jgi:hypothetical protein
MKKALMLGLTLLVLIFGLAGCSNSITKQPALPSIEKSQAPTPVAAASKGDT